MAVCDPVPYACTVTSSGCAHAPLACRALPLTARELLKDTVEILYRNFWPLILIFALTDVAMFALHRLSHRITNEGERLV